MLTLAYEPLMHFGEFLRALYESRGLTQADLARSSGVSEATIQRGVVSERCPWRRSAATTVLQAIERAAPLTPADAATYLQLAGLEALAKAAAESMRRTHDATLAAKAAMQSADVATRIDDPATVTAFRWIERLLEERGDVAVLAAMEGLAAGWSIDLPPRVRRDEVDDSRNSYFYGGEISAAADDPSPQVLTVVSPPVQKPGHVEQVFREYEARDAHTKKAIKAPKADDRRKRGSA